MWRLQPSLPLSQTSPTRHATAVAKRLRQVFPRNTCLQNIKNSLECILIADRSRAWAAFA